jgi:actin-related protein
MDNTSHVTPVAFAGNATPTPVFINCAGSNTTDACMTTGNGNIVLNGVITITWIPLGDNN